MKKDEAIATLIHYRIEQMDYFDNLKTVNHEKD